MEIIRIRVQMNGEKSALTELNKIDAKIDQINKKPVNIRTANTDAKAVVQLNDDIAKLNKLVAESTNQTGLLNRVWGQFTNIAIGSAIKVISSSFRDALTEMKAVDTELTNIQKVSGYTASEIEKIGDAAYATASKYGVAANEYLSAVYTFQKAGLGDSATQLGELATKTMLVGDTTADVASKFLIAVNAAWDMKGSMSALSTVVDQADYINNNYATSLDKLAAAMPIVASTSANLGMSVEETMAVIGTITSITQETGTKAATAWRALAMNITGELGTITDETGETIEVTTESVKSMSDALRIYGSDAIKAAQQTGELINPMEAVLSLAQAYKDGRLTDTALQGILMNVGGKLRTNQLTALVKDLASDTSIYRDMLESLGGAAGTADAEISIMLSSWESKTKILNNTWTEFVANTVDSGMVKFLLDSATAALDFGDNLGLVATQLVGVVTAFKTIKTMLDTKKAAQSASLLANDIAEIAGAKSIEGLTAAQKANELQTKANKAAHMAWLGYVGLAVTAVIGLYQGLKQHHENEAKAAKEAADNAQKEAEAQQSRLDKLDELIAKYKELSKNGGSADEIRGVQEEINSLLGDQYEAVDLVNGAYEEQAGILQGIRTDVAEMTESALENARTAAAAALVAARPFSLSSRQSIGMGGGSVLPSDISNMFSQYSTFSVNNTAGQAGISFKWADTADEIVSQYEDIEAATTSLLEMYKDTPEELAKGWTGKLYTWLTEQTDSMESAYNTYKALMESGDEEAAKDFIVKSAQNAADGVSEAAEEIEQAVNRITLAKQQLDAVLSAPSEDQAFTDISSALASFNQMVENGEIGSNAFWATAEFLAGPEVLKEYYGNAQGLIEYIKNSNLDEIFGAEGANGIVDALRNVDSAIASVVDRADGGMDVTIRDVDALSEALGLTKDQTFAALEALEKYGDFEYEGDDLLEYLEWLGVQMDKIQVAGEEIEGFTFSTLVRQLQDLGYNEYDIASVVSNLEAMGLIDLEDTEGSLSDIQTEMGKAKTAAEDTTDEMDELDGKTTTNVQSEIEGVGTQANRASEEVQAFGSQLDHLNGKVVTTRVRNVIENVTTNTVTTTTTRGSSGGGGLFSGVKKLFGFADGTSGAPGGPALVGDEPSRDGRPMPELISDNGNTYLAGVYGPEIVRLGKGATVFSNTETRNILSGNIPAYAFGNLSVSSTINKATTNKTTSTSSTVYYKVTFSPNGGSGGPSNVRFARGSTVTIPTTKPGRTGYYFIGWSRSSAAKRAEYQPKSTVKFSGDVKLYAVWEKKPAATKSTGSGSTGSLYSGGSGTTTTSYSSGGGGGGGSYYTGGGGGGGGGGGSADDPRDTLMSQINDELEDIEFKIWEGQKNGSMSNAQAIAAYKSAMDKINSYITKYQQMGENENSEYIQRLKKAWWSYSDEVEGIQNDLIAEMSDAVEEQLAELDKVKNERIAAINAAADAESNLNALEEKRLELLEAQDALLNAQSQRTVRIYNAATGQWEWVADADAVKSAQESVESAQKALSDEVSAQARESQIEAIESEYEALTQAWEAIQEGMKNPGRPLSAILAEIASSGTVSEQAIGSKTGTFAESIAAAASAIGSIGAVSAINGSNIMYGASPNGAGRILMGGTSSAGGEGNVSYYINGVEISGDRAESMTIADLARSMSTLAIYNNS